GFKLPKCPRSQTGKISTTQNRQNHHSTAAHGFPLHTETIWEKFTEKARNATAFIRSQRRLSPKIRRTCPFSSKIGNLCVCTRIFLPSVPFILRIMFRRDLFSSTIRLSSSCMSEISDAYSAQTSAAERPTISLFGQPRKSTKLSLTSWYFPSTV